VELHHHALLTMMAFTYMQHRRLASASQAGKKNGSQYAGSATAALIASHTSRDNRRTSSRDLRSVSSLQRHNTPTSA
jgi:hypothetical protein